VGWRVGGSLIGSGGMQVSSQVGPVVVLEFLWIDGVLDSLGGGGGLGGFFRVLWVWMIEWLLMANGESGWRVWGV